MKIFYTILSCLLFTCSSIAQNNSYQKKADSLENNIKLHKGNYRQVVEDLKQLVILHEDNNKYDLIFIGRLSEIKRADRLLKAIKLAKEKLQTLNAVIVGKVSFLNI